MKNFQFKIFNYTFTLKIKKNKKSNFNLFNGKLYNLKFLTSKFEFLNFIDLNNVNQNNIDCITDMFNKLIPLYIQDSQSAAIRNILINTINQIHYSEKKLIKQLNYHVALHNLNDNVIDRSISIYKQFRDSESLNNLNEKIYNYEKKYGANIINNEFLSASRDRSLVNYFSNNNYLIKNKKILHFAPELLLEDYLKKNSKLYNIDYTTTDIDSIKVDLNANLFDLSSFKENKFDLIIINRVFEHLIDDNLAAKNLNKLLHLDGIIIHSVPQNPSSNTSEWYINDISHDLHVRHYGANYEDLFTKNGFTIDVVDYLLNKSIDDHKRDKTYPMRLYISKKIQND